MSYSFFDFLYLLGALGIFIYGMKVMSEGIQKVAGSGLRKILGGMTSNRFFGVLTGFLVTALVQSSSATTVMVVSFVNAGLLTLLESISVIMGANIGTTVTAWLVAELGFKVKIVSVAIPLIGISFPFMFSKRTKWKHFAEFVMGFGILFIGLGFLKEAVPDIRSNPDILSFVQNYSDMGFMSVILFVFIGTLLTVVVQSSSASTALILVMVNQQWIGFDLAAAMFLGGNLGTTVTAGLAASAANLAGKRAALFHLLFNVLGVVWALMAFRILANMVQGVTGTVEADLALFHTIFNVITVIVLLPFVNTMEKLVVRIMSGKKEKQEYHLQYISSGLMDTNEISIEQASKEVVIVGEMVGKMFRDVQKILIDPTDDTEKLIDSIKRREDIADNIQYEMGEYLTKVSQTEISSVASAQIYAIHRMITELERVTDIIYEMSLSGPRFHETNEANDDDLKDELKPLLKLIDSFISLMNKTFEEDLFNEDLRSAYKKEEEVNLARRQIQQIHFKRLENGAYQGRAGIIYYDLVNSSEKIGDHIINILQAGAGNK